MAAAEIILIYKEKRSQKPLELFQVQIKKRVAVIAEKWVILAKIVQKGPSRFSFSPLRDRAATRVPLT